MTVYAGGGPALFGVETNFINGIPFATSSLSGTFPASLPTTVFNKNWVWGGAAQVGTTYAFAGGWFLDFSYNAMRGPRTSPSPIRPSYSTRSWTTTILWFCCHSTHLERLTNQSVALTLNYKFH